MRSSNWLKKALFCSYMRNLHTNNMLNLAYIALFLQQFWTERVSSRNVCILVLKCLRWQYIPLTISLCCCPSCPYILGFHFCWSRFLQLFYQLTNFCLDHPTFLCGVAIHLNLPITLTTPNLGFPSATVHNIFAYLVCFRPLPFGVSFYNLLFRSSRFLSLLIKVTINLAFAS